MKKIKLLLIGLLTLALLTGCSSSPSGTDTSKVRVATDTDLATMDHHIATDGTSFVAQSMILSGLMALDSSNKPVNELAKDYTVSEDGTVYTFTLVDAKWSNDTPVTAHDFVFGWQRLADPATASEYSFILETVKLKNAAAVISGELGVEELGVKALDDKTLEVTLDAPVEFFLGLLAFPSFFPLNKEFYESQNGQYAKTPENLLACGPYKMTSWVSGSGYVFEKNPSYFKADTITTDTVEFKFIQDTQSAMLEYESGNLDVVKLTGEQVDAYKDHAEFTNRLEGYLWYLSINFTVDKFENENLRKALALAIDRETIAKNVLKDGSVAAGGIIPYQLASGPDGKDFRDSASVVTEYDPDAAKDYYTKAKAELNGDVTIELLFEDTEASKAVAEYIQHNWETNLPGLTVTLNSKPKKTRLEMMRSQDFEVALTRWGPDYADPQTYMELFVTGNETGNSGLYSNSDYDALVTSSVSGSDAVDPSKRWQNFIDAEKVLVVDSVGVIPVYQNGGAVMIKSYVKGVEFHSAGVDSYRNIKIDK